MYLKLERSLNTEKERWAEAYSHFQGQKVLHAVE